MSNNVTFTPVKRPDCPALYAGPQGSEYVFQAIDIDGEVHIETFHVSFGDALHQIATRISLDPSVEYVITQGA